MQIAARRKWQFFIDRGGTFTDIVALRPDGALVTHKLLSDDPERYDDAALAGMRALLGLEPGAPISADQVESVKMGTTLATNALLERQGEPTLLLVTRGFADALRIGYQNRPRLFALEIVLPDLLYTSVAEIDERVGADGQRVRALDEAAAMHELEAARRQGLASVAIAFVHGYRYPEHERRVAELAARAGFEQISVSHRVSPWIKFVSRADTTLIDAYLSPVLRRHVERLAAELPGVRLMFMQSSGGLAAAAHFHGKDAILSGPAGGIVGMARASAAAGFGKSIGFDMGGTSTDVSHFDGEFEREFESEVAGVRVRAPMLGIHTVAAGGGSILHFDGQRFRVGPDSAGANPGPCCYRRGGPLTLTDCNLMLGKIEPNFFPKLFGPGRDQPLDREAVRARFESLAGEVRRAGGTRGEPERSAEDVAEGFVQVAVGVMARAIKRISVERGRDLGEYTLTAFGGAGGQHACLVAEALGIRRVFIHPLAGLLSAYGMGLAEQAVLRERSLELALTEQNTVELRAALEALERDAQAELREQGVAPSEQRSERRVHLKYAGTDTALIVPFGDAARMAQDFERAYLRRFSFSMPERPLIVDAVSVEVVGSDSSAALGLEERAAARAVPARVPGGAPLKATDTRIFSGGRWLDAPLYERTALGPGQRIAGPALIAEAHATTVVEPGWVAELAPFDRLILTDSGARAARVWSEERDPVLLEVFNNLTMAIAEQMGSSLELTAHSVNIKERKDFSCAVFDSQGELIANAPHMPVHLGSMSETIKTVIREHGGRMRPGDAYLSNDPYHGGTHLPDITLVTPVFGANRSEPLFYVGSRGHHADVGGKAPGSMPADSRTIQEEGVLFEALPILSQGRLAEAELRARLAAGPYPARNPEQNLADLRAQLAANQTGARELGRLIERFGEAVVRAYLGHIQDNAEQAVRRAIEALRDGAFEYQLDNGAWIRVRVSVDARARTACVDFSGSSAELPDNFNAPSAVCVAAVLYVFRSLIPGDIPLNAGCLRPLSIVIPAGSCLSPRAPAAVVAGNVETSQCISNALYGALGVMAAGQCTMNNFSFGDARHQYYETIAGGSGAGPGFSGTAVVQTHMTNSRMTDPEVLEQRFPVRVESFSIRPGSGGRGTFRGGDGGTRRLCFLAPMTASLLSNNRARGAFGLAGGEAGDPGRAWVERADGARVELDSVAEVQMQAGDVFVIETPGGGGYGPARD